MQSRRARVVGDDSSQQAVPPVVPVVRDSSHYFHCAEILAKLFPLAIVYIC
jgi:hypothetical protein